MTDALFFTNVENRFMVSYPPLIDRFGRKIGSIRISITDRCNLRCLYCMPEEGINWVERRKILNFEEIIRIIQLFRNCGIRSFRLTGGEPTSRLDIDRLVELITKKVSDIDLAMTTNGILLAKYAQTLKKSGLQRLNISLDTLDREKFLQLTRRDYFEKVMNGIDAAIDAGFENIKINVVALKGINTDETSLREFINFSEEKSLEIRFIELMPFYGIGWNKGEINNGGNPKSFISSKEIIRKIEKIENMEFIPHSNPSQTSRVWSLRNGKAKLGFISSVSESFCNNCNRIRVTAEGNLRPCLHESKEYPMLDLIRQGISDEELVQYIRNGLHNKWEQHPDFLSMVYLPTIPDREMYRIGG